MEHIVNETKTLLRNNTVEDYSLFGSFPDDADIRMSIHADGLLSARLIIHCDGLSSDYGEIYREYELVENEGVFSVTLSANELKSISPMGLYYYKYLVCFSDGIEEYAGEKVTLLEKVSKVGERQLLIYSSKFHTPDFLKQGIIYHIFVDRFARSGKCKIKDGSRWNSDWENGIPEYPSYPGARIDNREVFGGDLYGIIEKLPYINSLGVTCIYLSPIFDSPSNHKYDTSNYGIIDESFGGEQAFIELINEAKKYGIAIMLDGVFNHTGDDSIYFNKYGHFPQQGAYQSKDSPYYSWYYFEEYPVKYSCWWDIDILPKVNCDNLSYRNYVLGDNGIIEKYMKLGIAGFRLDVADELSSDFIEGIRNNVRRINPDGVVLGEVWEDASNKIAYSKRRHYFNGYELDSVMNYPVRNGIIEYVKNENSELLKNITEGLYRRYPKCVSDCLMNFLGTHDTERILTVLSGISSNNKSNDELANIKMTDEQKVNGIRMLKVAYTVLAFLYGIPSIFYGDEAGIEGYRDPFCRKPYPWGNECEDLIRFYRRIGRIRRQEKILKNGLFKVDSANEGQFVFRRYIGDETIIVISNASKEPLLYNCKSYFSTLLKTDTRIKVKDKEIVLQPMSSIAIKRNKKSS